MKTVKFVITGCIILAFSITSCKHQEENIADGVVIKDNSKQQSVEVVKPQQRSFIAEILITGTARPNRKVIVYAMESGYVETIEKDLGDVVQKGEIIAELSNPELLRQFEQKKVQVENKKVYNERLQSIREKTPALTTLQQAEDAEADYRSVLAELNAIQDRIGFLKVKAPFSGRITKKMVDNGALIQSGLNNTGTQGIVELQEINPIRLTVPLPESDIAAIDKGMEATITFPELAGEAFNAKVSRTAGALDDASGTMQVEMDIDNSKGIIKPGMYAKALMQIGSRNGVLSLPFTSQGMYQNQPFVFVVKDDKVERIPLRKGLSNKDFFEILNPEITENSLVIVQGKGLVQPGQIVKPVLKSE